MPLGVERAACDSGSDARSNMLVKARIAATFHDLACAAAIQLRGVRAIMIRDMMMRYGRNNIGFLWFILEPMILCAMVMGLWGVVDPPYNHGVGIVAFVFTGYMPLTLWRHMSTACINTSRRSAGLLWHRNITALDTILARLTMEFLGTTSGLLIIYLVLLSAGLAPVVADPGLALLGWLQMGMLAAATAIALAALTEWSETAERFIQPVQYILVPLSGFMIMVDWLPTYAQQIIVWNPLIHVYEMYRAGFFGEGLPTHYTLWYPALAALILATAGLWGLEAMRDRMHFN